MKILIVLLALLSIFSADQFVPIQPKPYGFSIGAPYGDLHI